MIKSDGELFFKGCGQGHPLDWRIEDCDPPRALQLVGKTRPPSMDSTRFIEVRIGQRSADGQWSLLFKLKDNSFSDIFLTFCNDLIEQSRNMADESAFEYVAERYQQWKKMFKDVSGGLGREEVQGLIGEMLVIRDILIPRYGEEVALNSWMNALLGKQDFVCPGMWYEVKSVLVGKSTVTISSLDQLDRDDAGELAIIVLRKTSGESVTGVTLNSLFEELKGSLISNRSKNKFLEIMRLAGYAHAAEYDEYVYELVQIDEYAVGADFPRIRRSEVKKGVIDARYEISIDGIVGFKV